jgi:hypothetical protein
MYPKKLAKKIRMERSTKYILKWLSAQRWVLLGTHFWTPGHLGHRSKIGRTFVVKRAMPPA